jgi:tryptophan synthase alpha chain
VTPTTPRDRALKIAQLSTGFLYCVSVVGITGERSALSPDLLEQLRWLRSQTALPMCVGFGISTPDHVRMLRDAADGVIVGSAIVRKLGVTKPMDEVVRDVGDLVEQLSNAVTSS